MAKDASEGMVRIFATLDDPPELRKRRWLSLGLGFGSHILALGIFFGLGILVPSEIEPWINKAPIYIDLSVRPKPPELRLLRPLKLAIDAQAPQLPRQQIQIPVLPPPQPAASPDLPKMLVQAPRPAEAPSPAAPVEVEPKPQRAPVQTGAFAGSWAVATLKLPAREVQTGGFGSPEGFSGEAQGESYGNVPRLGSFDLPVGPGYGNGLGGTRGARGTIASAGFGNGVAAATAGAGGQGGGTVRSGGFDVKLVTQASGAQRPKSPRLREQPVEILSKPKPTFTEEARRLGIQGEVVLAVIFTAEGRLRVLRVVQGLGHGLDESAWRAAEQIRFKPAQYDGEPVDFPATLRVVFELSG